MALLISSDWHLSDDPRDEYRFRIVEKVFPELIKKHKVTALLNLGDLTEEKDAHSAPLVNRVAGLFHRLSSLCPVIIGQGNHDWLASPEDPFFEFLSLLPNIEWVRLPTPLSDLPFDLDLPNSIILPHSADYERDWDGINFKPFDWAFAHQTFANATSDSGFKLKGVPLSYFPKNLEIISGDIHRPQSFGALTYVGSPYAVDFGDDFEARCLLIKDDGRLVSIPIEGPQKRLIEVNDFASSEKFLRMLDEQTIEGDIVKIRVSINSEDQANWPALSKRIRDMAAEKGVIVNTVTPLIKPGRAQRMLKSGPEARTDAELLTDYGKARGVDEGTLKVGAKFL